MNDKVFLDTNILVYAYDTSHLEKQNIAQKILIDSIENETGFISVQVIGEFFTVVTRKIQHRMPDLEAANIIEVFCIMNVVEIDESLVRRALEGVITYHISYWDSLIIAAAERAGCKQVFSEDLNHNQLYYDIQVINPFV
jgi:predicted nucleic acid-binding protein